MPPLKPPMGGGESSTGAQGGEESDPIHGCLTLTPVSQVQVRNEPHAPRSLSYSSSLPPPQPMLPRHLRRQFPQRILMTHAAALLGLMTPRPSNGDGETTPPRLLVFMVRRDQCSLTKRSPFVNRYTIIRLVRMRMPVGTALEQSVMEGHVLFLLQWECFAVGAMSSKPCAPTGERGARTSCSMNGQRKAST